MATKNRIPRKSKKWHKKMGYEIHFLSDGKVYFTRTFVAFRYDPKCACGECWYAREEGRNFFR